MDGKIPRKEDINILKINHLYIYKITQKHESVCHWYLASLIWNLSRLSLWGIALLVCVLGE